MAARPPRGGDGRFVRRDRVEYSRAHRVWWFVSVDPNHADVACPCGVLAPLERAERAAVEVSIQANPPRQGSARRRKPAGVHVGQVRAEEGRAELPSPRSPPQQPGLRNRLDGRPDCPVRTASLRCSGCSTRGGRFRSSRGFSGATPPWARTAATRSSIRRCRIRVAPPTSLRPNPYRSAALHRAVRRAARRHGGRPNHRWRCRETAQALSARFQRNARTVSVLG